MQIIFRFLPNYVAPIVAYLIFASPAYVAGQCSILTNAVQGISYTFVQGGGTNATSVAYNPQQNIYYAIIGGNTGFPLETFTPAGVSLYQTNTGFDSRGLWWNYSANQLQANGYANLGTWAFNLNGSGYALNTGISVFTGQNQPDVQSCGTYDCADNEVIYFYNGYIYRYSAATGALIGTVQLTGMPVALSSINTTTALYTGCTGNEIAVEDFVDKAILLFDKSTGAYSGQSLLPSTALADGYLHLAYANNLVWLYDVSARVWTSYSIFSGNPGGLAVNLGNDTSICTGQTLVLDAGNAGASYLWQDGSTNKTFTTTQPGTYSVAVSKACYTGTDTIVVGSAGALQVNLGADTTLCNGAGLLLNAATPGGVYVWQNGTTGPSYNVSSAGVYAVTVTAGGCSGADSIAVAYASPPAINLPADTTTCNNHPLILDAGNSGTNYLWSNGAISQTITADTGGIYGVSVTGAAGCRASASVMVLIDSVVVSLSPLIKPCGAADTLMVNVSSGSAPFTYLWSTGSNSALITGFSTGIYSATVTDTIGCSVSATDTVTVTGPGPVLVTSGLQVSPATCGLANGAINGLAITGGTLPYAQAWDTGNVLYSTSLALTGLTGAIYTLTVSDSNGCIADTTITITQTAGATAPVISASKDSVCSGDSVSICASPQNYTTYLWNSGATTPCINTTISGDYSVTVSQNNCSASSNQVHISNFPPTPVSVAVNGDTLTGYNATGYQWFLNGNPIAGATSSVYVAHASGAYTLQIMDMNGCSYNSNPISVTGLQQLAENSVIVFPNPTSTGWQLIVNETFIGSAIEVFDATGKIVYRSVISSASAAIDIPGLASGVYELRINTGQLNLVRKLVKI